MPLVDILILFGGRDCLGTKRSEAFLEVLNVIVVGVLPGPLEKVVVVEAESASGDGENLCDVSSLRVVAMLRRFVMCAGGGACALTHLWMR